MLKRLLFFIPVIFLLGCPHSPEIPDDYKGTLHKASSSKFSRYYDAHKMKIQEDITTARKNDVNNADKYIHKKDVEKNEYTLKLTGGESNFSIVNAKACQIAPCGEILAIIDEFDKEYNTFLKYFGETSLLVRSSAFLIDENERARFYLPFRWSNCSDMIAYTGFDGAYRHLYLAFVVKFDNNPLVKPFQVTDNYKDAFYYDPSWSYNDKFLAYTREDETGCIIQIFDLEKQKIESLKIGDAVHGFRFSSNNEYTGFAVKKDGSSYIPIVINDWREPQHYVSYDSLRSDCPLMRATFSCNGDRLALLQYTRNKKDSLRLAIIDLQSHQIFTDQKKLINADFFRDLIPLGDPVWLYNDNFLVSSSKDEVYTSFVNAETLDNGFDVLYLNPLRTSNISNPFAISYSPVSEKIVFLNPLENTYAYLLENFEVEKKERPVDVLTMCWRTKFEHFDNKPVTKHGEEFAGKTRVSIIGDYIPKELLPPGGEKNGVILKKKIGNKYANVLQFDDPPQPGEIVIIQWDIRLTEGQHMRSGTFFTELTPRSSYTATQIVK